MVDLFPYALELFNIQGAENVAQKNYDEAIDSYKQALKIRLDDASVLNSMAIALKNQGNYRELLIALNRPSRLSLNLLRCGMFWPTRCKRLSWEPFL